MSDRARKNDTYLVPLKVGASSASFISIQKWRIRVSWGPVSDDPSTSARVTEPPYNPPYRAVRNGVASMSFHPFPHCSLDDLPSLTTLSYDMEGELGTLFLGKLSLAALIFLDNPSSLSIRRLSLASWKPVVSNLSWGVSTVSSD